jgi:regulatory protein
VSVERGLELAYRYLSRRERTVAEVRAHLQARDLGAGLAEEAIDTLTGQGYLDDRRFARLFVQDKRELEQWGDERIRRGLAARGVEPELAEAAISENGGYGPELERAVALLRRRVPNPEPDRRGRERALGLLMRRGYDYELAADAVRAHLSE